MKVRFLGQKDPLEEGMATHSSILGWRHPWTEEPGWLVRGVAKSWTQLKGLSTQVFRKQTLPMKTIDLKKKKKKLLTSTVYWFQG